MEAGTTCTWLGGNSSSRIDQIEDVRAVSLGNYVTYQFNYNNDSGVPHLTSITNGIGTSEGYNFYYYSAATLTSPWGAPFGTATKMSSIAIAGVNLSYYLGYAMLDLAFEALATLVEARILVPQESPDAAAPMPSLAAGQEFAGFEIDARARSGCST